MQEEDISSKRTRRMVYTAISLVWCWGFWYASGYLELHIRWIMFLFQYIGLFCLVAPNIWIKDVCHQYYRNILNSLPYPGISDRIKILSWAILCCSAPIALMPVPFFSNDLFSRAFLLVLLLASVSLLVNEIPFWVYVCTQKTKPFSGHLNLKKILNWKKMPTFILAALTILTAFFQCIQVIMSFFSH